MANPYADRYSHLKVDFGKVKGRQDRKGARQRQNRADMLGLAGQVAPIAGGLLGAGIGTAIAPGVGTAAGGAIGSGIGGLAGAGLGYAADKQTEQDEEEERRRQARFDAVAQILGQMR